MVTILYELPTLIKEYFILDYGTDSIFSIGPIKKGDSFLPIIHSTYKVEQILENLAR